MGVNDYIGTVCITLIGLVYPGYQSFKSVKRADVSQQQAWLKYWLVLSVVSFCNLLLQPLLYDRIPIWNFLKVAVVSFLVLPMTKGYEKVYHLVLEPQLDKHEAVIDQTADQLYRSGEVHARNLGPTMNRLVQQGKDMASKTLNKKTT